MDFPFIFSKGEENKYYSHMGQEESAPNKLRNDTEHGEGIYQNLYSTSVLHQGALDSFLAGLEARRKVGSISWRRHGHWNKYVKKYEPLRWERPQGMMGS